jgi:bifunctional N-acetylglucosamine-1-phosphate-uridyltransferase/glucosamine-1-phosphate-acetyltransferase GlmU-like protein
VLELNCINNDWTSAKNNLPKVLDKANETWMLETTLGNLMILKQAQIFQGHDTEELQKIIKQFEIHIYDMQSQESKPEHRQGCIVNFFNDV